MVGEVRLSEQSAAASEELSAQARGLSELVRMLAGIVGGETGRGKAPVAAGVPTGNLSAVGRISKVKNRQPAF